MKHTLKLSVVVSDKTAYSREETGGSGEEPDSTEQSKG